MWITISLSSLIILFGMVVFFSAEKLSAKKLPKQYPAISWKACGVFIVIIGVCILVALLAFVHDVDIALSSGTITVSIFVIGGIVGIIQSVSVIKEHKKELSDIKTAEKQLSSVFYTSFSGSLGSVDLHVEKRHPEFEKLLTYQVHSNSIYTDIPKRHIYTSATVGGVTTGGITEVGGYTDITKYSSGAFELGIKEIKVTADNKEFVHIKPIKRIVLSSEILELAKKSKISEYINKDSIIVIEDVDIPAGIGYMSTNAALNAYDVQTSKGYPSMEKCIEIIEWISGR